MTKTEIIIMLIYIDEIIIIGNTNKGIEEVARDLNKTFALKDLRDLNFCLGYKSSEI